MVFELVTGDYLFHPLGNGERDKDVQQLAQARAAASDHITVAAVPDCVPRP